MDNKQINDRYEFPLELDLDTGDGKYLTEDADRSVRNLYHLHSVLVHSGGVHGGHYYAFIRPDLAGDQWFKFDDERVTKQDSKVSAAAYPRTPVESLLSAGRQASPPLVRTSLVLTNGRRCVRLAHTTT